MMVSRELVFVGIDVGKFTCVAAVHGRAGVLSFVPDAPGIAQLHGFLATLQGELRVGLEATGGCEAALWEALEAAGVHVRQLAPARVHAFARPVGRLTKTDRYDAVTIAACLAANPEAGRRLPTANVREISALCGKRRQLIEMRKALTCQMKQTRDPAITALNDTHLALIEAQIATLEATLEATVDARIAADPELAQKRRLLRSIPGIGEVASATLLAEMPEPGSLRPRAAAALAGLAPFSRDSGTVTGKRFIQGGRAVVRSVLYMAALSASHHNPSLKPFAANLKANHKPGKVTLTAVARKLVELANAILTRRTEWVVK